MSSVDLDGNEKQRPKSLDLVKDLLRQRNLVARWTSEMIADSKLAHNILSD